MIKRLKDTWNQLSPVFSFPRMCSFVPLILSIAVFQAASPQTIDTKFEQLGQLIGYSCGLSLLIMFMILFYYASVGDKLDELEKQIGELKQ